MNRNVLGGIVAVSLIITALLLGYIFMARTSSGYRAEQFSSTMSFFEDRIAALERQRGLLKESAATLREQADLLNKRVGQIDVEIQNMSSRLNTEKRAARTPFYSWRSFSFNTSSGLIVIAFLVFIWLLYSTIRKGRPETAAGGDEGLSPGEPQGETPVPGSVLEEEFQAAPEESGAEADKHDEAPEEPVDGGDGERPAGESGAETAVEESGERPVDAEEDEVRD